MNADPGFDRAARSDRVRIRDYAGESGSVHLLPREAGMLVAARYPAFEGVLASGPHLRIGLCTGRASRMVQEIGGTRLEGFWRPGTLAIMPPDCAGHAASGAVAMVGLAIVPSEAAPLPDADRLHRLAGCFHQDGLIASVLTALRHEADAHGSSSAFFEHGIAVILRRLWDAPDPADPSRKVHPLSTAGFRRLAEYVNARLGDDLRVVEMAAVVGKDPSGFPRALRARTGLTPYAWLTARRMDHAAHLLGRRAPVTQVATAVGYANVGKFAAAFRRMRGQLPSARRGRGLA